MANVKKKINISSLISTSKYWNLVLSISSYR